MIIGRPVRGGGAFAGKSGLKTADACQASAMEMSTITAAHFMSCGLIKTETRGKKIFVNTVVKPKPSPWLYLVPRDSWTSLRSDVCD